VKLNQLKPQAGAKKVSKRRGRGEGSGNGSTAGRGNNGAHARSGAKHKRTFEGGQTPLQRRLPKRGFNSHVVQPEEVNLAILAKLSGTSYDVAGFEAAGLISSDKVHVKLIGKVQLDRALVLKVHAATAGAKESVEKAGGKIELIEA
jgi:large subunit ribosomal protein L15